METKLVFFFTRSLIFIPGIYVSKLDSLKSM